MTTPIGAPEQTLDIHADPEFAAQYNAPRAETIAQNFREALSGSDRPTCNVGQTEQIIRISTGVALITAAAVAPINRGLRLGMAAVGMMELITGSTRYCPLWQSLGINTNRG